MISSKELLTTGGISRATLNNYIKLGILPRPIVRKPDVEKGGPRQMGYFPSEALDILKKVNAMKSEGYSMEMITAKLKPAQEDVPGKEVRGLFDSQKEKKQAESLPLFSDQVEEPHCDTPLGKRKSKPTAFKNGEAPALLAFSVLSATLQDCERLRREMLPEVFFALIKKVWTVAGETVRINQGLITNGNEGGMMVLFSSNVSPDHIKKALRAAIEIQNAMKMISQDILPGPRSWPSALHLNIGISRGEEYIEKTTGLMSGVITSPGFAFADAAALSQFACNGAIWATKDAICRLSMEDRKAFRHGVRRGDVFAEFIFSRLSDLPSEDREGAPCPVYLHDRLFAAEILS